ncbi:MAG: hypothetical protein IKK03_14270, partial [Lachnospiraceae bacterium]|nr:hypothetical protein [Lachnospiraceae bacterium]
ARPLTTLLFVHNCFEILEYIKLLINSAQLRRKTKIIRQEGEVKLFDTFFVLKTTKKHKKHSSQFKLQMLRKKTRKLLELPRVMPSIFFFAVVSVYL